jgi:hypothetical protein
MLSSHLYLDLAIISFLQISLSKPFIHFFPMHATCPTHFMLLHLIILKISCNMYKLWSSSLSNFLQPPVTSTTQVQIFSPASCSRTPSIYVLSWMSGTKFHIHIKEEANYSFVYCYTTLCGSAPSRLNLRHFSTAYRM